MKKRYLKKMRKGKSERLILKTLAAGQIKRVFVPMFTTRRTSQMGTKKARERNEVRR